MELRKERAFVGLGGNVGDVAATLRRALHELEDTPGVEMLGVSSAYRTDAVGPVDQAPFLNAVAGLATTLEPEELLDRLLAVEASLGRTREVRFGPRTCDLDLLLYGDRTIHTARLEVPHPRLAERRFALEPLAELDPALRLPDGRPVTGLLEAVQGQVVEQLGPL
jgi:2-amino-4-hydroxy-6-hydroxymethyldihydropteridine diphosphokinase